MIKILMDARALGTKPSGIGMYIYTLVNELRKYPDLHIELITDVAKSEEMRKLIRSGMLVFEYGKTESKSASLLWYYRFVQQCIEREKPDIFWEGNNLCPILIQNPYGLLYTTIHDMFPLSDPKHFALGYPQYFHHGMKKTIHTFDRLIYNSEDCRKHTEEYFPEARNKKYTVGYIIVPEMPKLPITDNGAYLYIGNLETRKGTDLLLRAYEQYIKHGGTRPLRFAGKIRDREIQVMLDKLEKTLPSMQYLGYVSEQQKAEEYASCHAFLFPSRAEGFGIPVVEALAYQKPVIAADLPSLREIAGDAIQYIPVDRHCVGALAKEMLRDHVIRNVEAYRGVTERFSEKTIGCRYHEMILADFPETCGRG